MNKACVYAFTQPLRRGQVETQGQFLSVQRSRIYHCRVESRHFLLLDRFLHQGQRIQFTRTNGWEQKI